MMLKGLEDDKETLARKQFEKTKSESDLGRLSIKLFTSCVRFEYKHCEFLCL